MSQMSLEAMVKAGWTNFPMSVVMAKNNKYIAVAGREDQAFAVYWFRDPVQAAHFKRWLFGLKPQEVLDLVCDVATISDLLMASIQAKLIITPREIELRNLWLKCRQ